MSILIDPTIRPEPTTPEPTDPPPAGTGALALHTATPASFNPAQEFINVILSAAIRSRPENLYIQEKDPLTNLPSRMVNGAFRIGLTWAASGFTPETHVFGRYAIRHNLPSTYTVDVSLPSLSGSTANRIIIDALEVRNWFIDISGPNGPMPDGWFIEAVKLSNEAAYDNTALPRPHPSRVFVPEFLDELRKWKPIQKRFMKTMATEAATIRDYYPDVEGLYNAEFGRGSWIYPRDVMVALCNEFDISPYFNLGSGARDPLVTSFATYVRDNLKPSLPVYAACANEYWNSVYNLASNRYLWAPAWRKFKTKGQGTVTIDATARTMTFNNAPDIRTLRPGGTRLDVLVDDFVFGLDMVGRTNNAGEVTVPAPTATVASFLGFLSDDAVFDAVEAEYWFSSDGNELQDRGYTMVSTKQLKIWADVFEAGNQRSRLVNVWESQLANDGRFREFQDTSWWEPFDDYIDPLTVFDAVAINPYFGSGTFKDVGRSSTVNGPDGRGLLLDNDFTAYIRPFAENGNATAYSRALRDYMLDRPIPGVALSTRSVSTYLGAASRRWRDRLRPVSNTVTGRKLRMIAYEGGAHIIHSVLEPANRVSDQDIVNLFVDGFMQSPEATEVFTEWADLYVRYYDGPLMQFNFVQGFSRFGAYGLIPFFGGPTDSRQELLLNNYVNRAPWWVDNFPPQAPPVPPQVWTAGVDPAFTLDDWVSNNATVFSGTPPAGMTLDGGTGALTGRPEAGSGDYSFTASNFAGSVEVTIRIDVSP